MSARLLAAFQLAEHWHRGQVRKYTGVPYIVHPIEVAQSVASVTDDQDVVIAALFHDLVEDTAVTFAVIRKGFGENVAALVHQVTDVSRPEMGNRDLRKALDREHLVAASPQAKTIKLADMISNTRDILQNDNGFAKVYLREKRLLLPLLKEGDARLYNIAEALIKDWEKP